MQNHIIAVIPGSPAPTVHVRSSLSLQPLQVLQFPISLVSSATGSLRLLTPITLGKAPVVAVAAPVDKAGGAAVVSLDMAKWEEQIDELLQHGNYADAVQLLENLGKDQIADWVRVDLDHDVEYAVLRLRIQHAENSSGWSRSTRAHVACCAAV